MKEGAGDTIQAEVIKSRSWSLALRVGTMIFWTMVKYKVRTGGNSCTEYKVQHSW